MRVMSGQTRILLSLRWTMLREPRSRLALSLLAGCAVGLLVGAILVGARLSDAGDRSFGVALVMPSLLLGFALSAVVSPLAAGGGNQLFPPEQLSPFPIRPSTHFRSSLLLTPINLAWLLQVVALAGGSAFVTGPGPRLVLALIVIGVVCRPHNRCRTGPRMVDRRLSSAACRPSGSADDRIRSCSSRGSAARQRSADYRA